MKGKKEYIILTLKVIIDRMIQISTHQKLYFPIIRQIFNHPVLVNKFHTLGPSKMQPVTLICDF